MALTRTRITAGVCLGIICLMPCTLPAQQFLENRILELDRQEKYAEALALCEKNVDTPAALYLIGDYYFHGRKGIGRDERKGAEYYQKACDRLLPRAKAGDALSQYRVARCLEIGKKDMHAAAAWYAYAAEGGNAKAMTRVALLEKGVGTPAKEVMGLFRRAADLGDLDAKAELGLMLTEHQETQLQEQGLERLNEAAKAGSPVALARLGDLYFYGRGGVKKDAGRAARLLQAAIDRGFSGAAKTLERVHVEMPPPPWRPSGAAPGFGYPGKLVPYEDAGKLKEGLEKFRMTAGWFVRDPIPPEVIPPQECPDRLPWLLYSPARSRQPVPMVIYFGGTGEEGTDLSAHFRQSVAIAKVTSPEFQAHHPCYFFAPMLPKGHHDVTPYGPGNPPHLTALVNDAMYALIRTLDNPPVDTNRIYTTGLSRGGSAAYGMLSSYPGRFAAAVPAATSLPPGLVPANHPGNYWLFINEGDLNKKGVKEMLDKTAEAVRAGGGDFRLSAYPGGGHDAWSKAWREDGAWEWMFSKSLGRPPAATPRLTLPACSASIPGRDAGSGPGRGADGLDGTAYVSATPAAKGDWWMAEYPEPVIGRVTVETGTRDGKGALSNGKVEVSVEGEHWFWAGDFDRSGICRFALRAPIRFLRILPEPGKPEVLTVRKVTVTP